MVWVRHSAVVEVVDTVALSRDEKGSGKLPSFSLHTTMFSSFEERDL